MKTGMTLCALFGLLALTIAWPRSADAHIVERVHMTKRDQVTVETEPFIATNMRDTLNDDVLVFEMTLTDPAP